MMLNLKENQAASTGAYLSKAHDNHISHATIYSTEAF